PTLREFLFCRRNSGNREDTSPSLGSFPNGVQRPEAAQVEAVVSDRGGSGEVVVERVGGEQLEFAAGLDDADCAVARGQIDAPRGENRGGTVAIGMEAVQVKLRARPGVQTLEQAVVPDQVNAPLVHQGRWHLGRSL